MKYSDIVSGQVDFNAMASERWQVIVEALEYVASDNRWVQDGSAKDAEQVADWVRASRIGDGCSMMQLCDQITQLQGELAKQGQWQPVPDVTKETMAQEVAEKAATLRRLNDDNTAMSRELKVALGAAETNRRAAGLAQEELQKGNEALGRLRAQLADAQQERRSAQREMKDCERREWNALVQDRDEFKHEAERVGLVNARLMATNNIRQRKLSELITQRHAYRTKLAAIDEGKPAAEVFGLHHGHTPPPKGLMYTKDAEHLRDTLQAKIEECQDLTRLVADRVECYRKLYNRHLAQEHDLREAQKELDSRMRVYAEYWDKTQGEMQAMQQQLVDAKAVQKRTASDRDDVGELLDSEMESLEKDLDISDKQAAAYKAERDQLRLANDSHLYRIAQLEELVAEVRQENDSLDSRCASAKQERTQAIAQRQDAIKEVAEIQETLNQAMVQLQGAAALAREAQESQHAAEKEAQNIKATWWDADDKKIARLQDQLAILHDDSERICGERDLAQQRWRDEEKRCGDHMARNVQLRAALTERNDELGQLQNQGSASALQAQLEHMVKSYTAASSDRIDALNHMYSVQKETDALRAQVAQLKADLAQGTDSETLGEALDDCIAERDAALAQQDRLTYLYDMEAAQVRRQKGEIEDWKTARDRWEEERAQEQNKAAHDLVQQAQECARLMADRDFYRQRLQERLP